MGGAHPPDKEPKIQGGGGGRGEKQGKPNPRSTIGKGGVNLGGGKRNGGPPVGKKKGDTQEQERERRTKGKGSAVCIQGNRHGRDRQGESEKKKVEPQKT